MRKNFFEFNVMIFSFWRLTYTYSFRHFFHGSGFGFSRSNSDLLADPDRDSGKKSVPDPDKRTRIRNTVIKTGYVPVPCL